MYKPLQSSKGGKTKWLMPKGSKEVLEKESQPPISGK